MNTRRKTCQMMGLFVASSLSLVAQVLYVPSGTSGVGSSSNGNVGIGTSNPAGYLDVAGLQIVHRQMSSIVTSQLAAPNNSTDSNRYEVARVGFNQHHWQSSGLITVELFQTYYSSAAYQKWHIQAGFGIPAGAAWLTEKIGGFNHARIVLGTPIPTGGSFGGYPNQYIPIYVDVSNYTQWRVRITHHWTETADDTPEHGQIRLLDFPSPTLLSGIFVTAPPAVFNVAGNAFIEGNMAIGTTTTSHPLTVSGTIRAKEIIVDTGWADYVFADDYRLAPLDEVEAHIKEHRHLPGIPSAAEVADRGVSLGEMQTKLLAKVEELTLHVIRQEKQLKAQQEEIQTLRIQRTP